MSLVGAGADSPTIAGKEIMTTAWRRGRRSRPRASCRIDRLVTLISILAALAFLLAMGDDVSAQETIVALTPLVLSQTTGEKPQSKVWRNDGRWWAVLPSTAVSPTGTWLWRLGTDRVWVNLLRL